MLGRSLGFATRINYTVGISWKENCFSWPTHWSLDLVVVWPRKGMLCGVEPRVNIWQFCWFQHLFCVLNSEKMTPWVLQYLLILPDLWWTGEGEALLSSPRRMISACFHTKSIKSGTVRIVSWKEYRLLERIYMFPWITSLQEPSPGTHPRFCAIKESFAQIYLLPWLFFPRTVSLSPTSHSYFWSL